MKFRILVLAAGVAWIPAVHAQQPLTLRQVIDLAQRQGLQSRISVSQRESARWRDKAFYSLRLPQVFLTGSLPTYSRAIVPVVQPDGSTLYTPLTSTDANAGLSISQQLPLTGGNLTLRSTLDNLQVNGASKFKSWSSVPMSISLQRTFFGRTTPAGMRECSRSQPRRRSDSISKRAKTSHSARRRHFLDFMRRE